MAKHFHLILLCFTYYFYVYTQNFSIENTEVLSENPYKVKIHLTGKYSIAKEDIKIFYNSKETYFEWKLLSSYKPRAYCFLVETSGFTHGEPIKNFKNAIQKLLNSFNVNDKIAICSFESNSVNQKSNFQIILQGKNSLQKKINDLTASADSNSKVDIYQSVWDALKWLSKQKDTSEAKYLIVFTAGIHQKGSQKDANTCIELSKQVNIPIYVVIHTTKTPYSGELKHLANETQGHHKLVDKENQILEFLKAAIPIEERLNPIFDYQYELTFMPKNVQAGINLFEIKIKDEIITSEFIVEKNQNTQMETILFIGVGVGVLLIVLGLLLGKKKKNVIEENQLTPELSQANSTMNKTFEQQSNLSTTLINQEAQKTAIATSNVPTLRVNSASGMQNYTITRLPIKIGRAETNDLIIMDNSVSKVHAELIFEKGYFYLVDLNSTNGIVVNGQRTAKAQLKENEKIYLGNASIELFLA